MLSLGELGLAVLLLLFMAGLMVISHGPPTTIGSTRRPARTPTTRPPPPRPSKGGYQPASTGAVPHGPPLGGTVLRRPVPPPCPCCGRGRTC